MDSSWPEEENFACSVCLETLKEPTTLTCGHSYCLSCIENHWDKENNKGQYSCPQCRQLFTPRPYVAKNRLLAQAMEKLRTNSIKQSNMVGIYSTEPVMPVYLDVISDTGPRKGSVYPPLPSVEPSLCPQHKQPLDLFCYEDKACVCVMCCQDGHHVVGPQEERRERQEELVQVQAEVHRRIQETERNIREIPYTARQQKALLQALQRESSDLFPELVKSLNLTGTQVDELLIAQEKVFDGQVKALVKHLEQDLSQLRQKSEELGRLVYMHDNISFLKNFLLMEPLGETGTAGQSGIIQEEGVVASIRSVIKELQESVQNLCKQSLSKIGNIVGHEPMASTPNSVAAASTASAGYSGQAAAQASVYEEIDVSPPPQPMRPHFSSTVRESSRFRGSMSQANPPPLPPFRPQGSGASIKLVNPEPKTREEMLKFRFEPTIDPNTAYRHMKLSDDCRKVTMRPENLNPPEHPDRFFFWRQVLCKEPLAGSPYYWEVEWTGQKASPYTQALNANLPFIYALLIIIPSMIVSAINIMFMIVFWRGMVRHLVDGLLLGHITHQNLLLTPTIAWFSVLSFVSVYATMQITIGVAFKDMERKGNDNKSRLGHNPQSWSLYWSGTGYSFWHNNQEKLLGLPKATRIGIYLDQHAGILNFYNITNNQAYLIHHHETQFTGPLYAGFRLGAGIGDSLTICQLN